MPRSGWTLLAVALAGCAETAAVADPAAAVRSGQERACAAVVAEHVGMTTDAVTAVWDHATAEATAIVTADVPGRPHNCEVDDQARVLALFHIAE